MAKVDLPQTVADIEKGGDWVCVRNNAHGYSSDLLHYWRRYGCPYLKGRKIKTRRIALRVEGQRGVRSLWFFHAPTLAEIAAQCQIDAVPGNKPYARYPQHWTRQAIRRKWRAKSGTFVDNHGREWVAPRTALKLLGVSTATLHRWRCIGCPYLSDSAPLQTLPCPNAFDREDNFFALDQIDEVKRQRAKCRQKMPAASELLTIKQAMRMSGLSRDTLLRLRKNGEISSENMRVQGTDGKLYNHVFFKRVELMAAKTCRVKRAPKDTLTVTQAAEQLNVSNGTIMEWTRGCPYLDRPLYSQTTKLILSSRGSVQSATVVSKADIRKLKKILFAGYAPPFCDERGEWLSVRHAARYYGTTASRVLYYAQRGDIEAKRVVARDRWSRSRGWRWVCLQSSLDVFFEAGGMPPRRTQAMAAANSVTDGGEEREPLPQQPWPVYILQPPDQPIPVRCTECGERRSAEACTCPVWDEEASELSWNGRLVRRYTSPAKNQRDIIEAFARAGWPRRIDDPFQDPIKLNKTLADLNARLEPQTIRFRADGTGEGAIWDIAVDK